MKIVTSLGDDVTVEVSYLEDIAMAYVVNSKSNCEFPHTELLQNFFFMYFLWVQIYRNQRFLEPELFKSCYKSIIKFAKPDKAEIFMEKCGKSKYVFTLEGVTNLSL